MGSAAIEAVLTKCLCCRRSESDLSSSFVTLRASHSYSDTAAVGRSAVTGGLPWPDLPGLVAGAGRRPPQPRARPATGLHWGAAAPQQTSHRTIAD